MSKLIFCRILLSSSIVYVFVQRARTGVSRALFRPEIAIDLGSSEDDDDATHQLDCSEDEARIDDAVVRQLDKLSDMEEEIMEHCSEFV